MFVELALRFITVYNNYLHPKAVFIHLLHEAIELRQKLDAGRCVLRCK
jgi:hypothetical protein